MLIGDQRNDLNKRLRAVDNGIDRMFTDLAQTVDAAVRKHAVIRQGPGGPESVITPVARRRIMRDVDRALDTIFGARKGSKSALGTLIDTQAMLAAQAPVARTVTDITGAIGDGSDAYLRRRFE